MTHGPKRPVILFVFPLERIGPFSSLSKNYADEHIDIDFFIITETNRLWIARTLMRVFYKMARLVGRHRWFCMNYYIDEAAMEIEEKNIFWPWEIITLIPMKGEEQINRFKQQNRWTGNSFRDSGGTSGRYADQVWTALPLDGALVFRPYRRPGR